jgi:hypothetical protein
MSLNAAFSSNLARPTGNVPSLSFAGDASPVAGHNSFNDAFANYVTNPWPGKRTNETSSVPMQIKPYREGYERVFKESDMIFNLHLWQKDQGTSLQTATSHSVANLAYLNYLLCNMGDPEQRKWLGQGDLGLPALSSPGNEVDILMMAPQFVGVMRNE